MKKGSHMNEVKWAILLPVTVKHLTISFRGGDWMPHWEKSLICRIVSPLGPTSKPTYLEQHQIFASLSGTSLVNIIL